MFPTEFISRGEGEGVWFDRDQGWTDAKSYASMTQFRCMHFTQPMYKELPSDTTKPPRRCLALRPARGETRATLASSPQLATVPDCCELIDLQWSDTSRLAIFVVVAVGVVRLGLVIRHHGVGL